MNKAIASFKKAAQASPKCEDGIWSQTYVLPADFIGFAGHFEANPILPAVMQIELALVFIEAISAKSPTFLGLKNSKFTRMVRPEEPILLSCAEHLDFAKAVKVTLTVDGEAAASLSLNLAP